MEDAEKASVSLDIRPAVPEDAAGLLALYVPYVQESWVTFECVPPLVEEFRRRITEYSRTWCAGGPGRSWATPTPTAI